MIQSKKDTVSYVLWANDSINVAKNTISVPGGETWELKVLYTLFTEKYSGILKEEQAQNLSCRDWNRQSKQTTKAELKYIKAFLRTPMHSS